MTDWTANAKRYYIKRDRKAIMSMTNTDLEKLYAWCDKNCKGQYILGMGYGMFELDSDATMFMLRWG